MDAITFQQVSKSYIDANDNKVLVFQNLNLSVREHEILCLFGPNGCGKTTLINLCAGLTAAESGSIRVFGLEPREVRIGYIPQSFSESLFPWLTNLDNICFPDTLGGLPRARAREKALAFIKEFDIRIRPHTYPYESSGGQKQLVSLGRALISDPSALLADEPFTALDYNTRLEIQDQFLEIVSQRLRLATIFVSHSVEDAIYMGDRLVVLSKQPSQIVDMFEIDLPRPRIQEMKKSAEFLQFRTRAIDAFMRGMGR